MAKTPSESKVVELDAIQQRFWTWWCPICGLVNLEPDPNEAERSVGFDIYNDTTCCKGCAEEYTLNGGW